MDNGSKKYKVIISDKNIFIFSNDLNSDWLVLPLSTKRKESQNKQIFIGKNTKKYCVYNGLFSGSSILVENKKNSYLKTEIVIFILFDIFVIIYLNNNVLRIFGWHLFLICKILRCII